MYFKIHNKIFFIYQNVIFICNIQMYFKIHLCLFLVFVISCANYHLIGSPQMYFKMHLLSLFVFCLVAISKKKAYVPEIVLFMNQWAAANFYCEVDLPVADVNTPEGKYRARTKNEAHISDLIASFTSYDSPPSIIEVLVICPEGQTLPSKKNFAFHEWHPTLRE